MKQTRQILSVLAALVALTSEIKVHATAYTTAVSGDWSVAANWSPAGVPGASDTVTFKPNFTMTVSDTESVSTITFTRSTGNTAEKLSIITGGQLTISGTSTPISSSGSTGTATVDLSSGTGTLIFSGVASTFVGSGVTFTAGTAGSTVGYSASGITVAAEAYDNLTLSGGGTAAVNSTATAAGVLTLSGGTAVSNGNNKLATIGGLIINDTSSYTVTGNTTTTINGNVTLNGTSTFTRDANTTVTGSFTVNTGASYLDNNGNTSLTIDGSVTNLGTFGLGSSGGNDSTLTLAGASGAISGGTFTCQLVKVNGSYTLQSGATLSVGTKNAGITGLLTGTGALTNQGTLVVTFSANGLASDVSVSTLDFSTAGNTYVINSSMGSSTQIPAVASGYYNLTLNANGGGTAWDLSAGPVINGNLTFGGSSGATAVVSAWPASITIGGTVAFNSTKGITLPGTFTCAAFNQTAGTVTVPSGDTLTIISPGSGTFTKLVNSGTISGSVATVSGSQIYTAPNGVYATGAITANLSLAAGGTLNLTVNHTAAGPNDALTVGGVLTLNNTTLNLAAPSAGAFIDTANDYTLVTAASISGTPVLNWVTAPADSANYSLIVSATAITLHYTAPPSTTALISSENPSGFNDSVTFTAMVQTNSVTAADGTGTFTFQTNGVAVSTAAVVNGSASFSISTLPSGTNVITAIYSGGNYVASSSSLNQIVTNIITGGLPALTQSVSGSTLTISWDSVDFPGYTLYQSTDLSTPTWTPVTNGSPAMIQIDPTVSTLFFHLSNP